MKYPLKYPRHPYEIHWNIHWNPLGIHMKIALKYPRHNNEISIESAKCSYESAIWNRQTIEWNALPITYERKTGKLMKEIHRQLNETFHWTSRHYKQSPAVSSRHLSGFYHKSGYHQSQCRMAQDCRWTAIATTTTYGSQLHLAWCIELGRSGIRHWGSRDRRRF